MCCPQESDIVSKQSHNQNANAMKTIGLIGGMSWESTVPYYRIINETVKEKLGGLHSAKLVLVSRAIPGLEKNHAPHCGHQCPVMPDETGQPWEGAGVRVASKNRRNCSCAPAAHGHSRWPVACNAPGHCPPLAKTWQVTRRPAAASRAA